MKLVEPNTVWKHMDDVTHHYMTCVNHPTARYITKNPWTRSLHFITPAEGFKINEDGWSAMGECPCPFSDLRVIIDEEE